MGVYEETNKRKQKRNNIRKIILQTIYVAGVMSAAIVAPNVIGAMSKLGLAPNQRQKNIIQRSRLRLIKQGLISYQKGNLSLTKKGERELRLMELRSYEVKKPKKWDKKWRVLIFDIPEKRRSLRSQVRVILSSIGFIRLQDSVWAYPYDCEDTITLLKADLNIGKDLLYLIVDSIENDTPYRKHFGLD
jgi:DNA-binding transcriptional regulator PaaX